MLPCYTLKLTTYVFLKYYFRFSVTLDGQFSIVYVDLSVRRLVRVISYFHIFLVNFRFI
jgi:hypothetical protein